jgi:predicted ATPase/DNA-binding CsgD family transcriptional regulator
MSQIIANLPIQADSFIGREPELAEVSRLLEERACRILTLVGPGGAGKTRLATEAAFRAASSFGLGAHFVALDNVHGMDLLVSRIAETLKFSLRGPDDPRSQLVEHLSGEEALILLDNFEQLVGTGAELLGDIVTAAPGVKLLVTSREALNLREERVFPLSGMRFPPRPTDEGLSSYDAVKLFVDRARRANPAYSADDDWGSITSVVALVQGMPLGIELAAAWTKVLPVADIAGEIERSLDFLETKLRNVPERHRSMRAVFDGSWNQLTDEQRDAMARLSVLRGSFGHAAAAEIACAGLPVLSALVDKSLLRPLSDGRHQIHEFLRQYASERLSEDPEKAKQARDAHCAHFTREAHRQLELFKSGRQIEMAVNFERGLENFRAAWEWAVESKRLDDLSTLIQPLAMFCQLRGRYVQAVSRLEAAVRSLRECEPSEAAGRTLALALVHLGWFYIRLGRLGEAETALNACRSIYAELGALPPADFATDPAIALGVIASARGKYADARLLGEEGLATSLKSDNAWDRTLAYYVLARAAFLQGRNEEALEYARQSYELAQALHHDWFVAYALLELGNARSALGNLNAAKKDYSESYEIRRRFDDPEGMAIALTHLGEVALAQKSFNEGRKLFERSVVLYREIHDKGGLAQSLRGCARAGTAFGDFAAARAQFREAIQLSAEIRHVAMLLTLVCNVGEMLLRRGETAKGTALLKLALGHARSDFATKTAAEAALQDAKIESGSTTAAPGPAECETATQILTQSLAVPSDLGIADLLAKTTRAHLSESSEAPYPDGLTEREVEILKLMARGKSNRDIGEELFITPNTVANHVKNVLSKTATSNRTEAAAYARDRNLA